MPAIRRPTCAFINFESPLIAYDGSLLSYLLACLVIYRIDRSVKMSSDLFQKSSKTVSVGCAALMLCAVFGCLAPVVQEAYAVQSDGIAARANTKDLPFKFIFKSSGDTYQGDEPRRKSNKTPVYIKVEKIACDYCRAYIDGSYSSSGPWTNLTVSGLATIKKKGEFSISSTVREKGATWARLTGWAESHSGNVSGQWSPDSKGTYTSINGYQGIK